MSLLNKRLCWDIQKPEINSTLLNSHLRGNQVTAALLHSHWLCFIRVYFVKRQNACFCNPNHVVKCEQLRFETIFKEFKLGVFTTGCVTLKLCGVIYIYK